MASETFDLPIPFAPAMQVKGPKRMSMSRKFLKPWTSVASASGGPLSILWTLPATTLP